MADAGFRFEEITGGTENINIDNLESTRRVRRFQAIDTIPTSVGYSDYFDFVADYAMGWVATNAATTYTPIGILYWNEIQISEKFYSAYYEIAVTYGPHDRQVGAYTFSVDNSGGTVHVTTGEVIDAYGDKPDDWQKFNVIGLHGDIVEGVDIPVEQPKVNITFRHPKAFLNRPYIRSIGTLVGFPNADTFLGYEPGEVMYLGGPFTESDTEATASYQFAISYNRFDFVVSGIHIVKKYGWDLLDPIYENDDAGGEPIKKVKWFKTIRPAGREWKNYKGNFGWG